MGEEGDSIPKIGLLCQPYQLLNDNNNCICTVLPNVTKVTSSSRNKLFHCLTYSMLPLGFPIYFVFPLFNLNPIWLNLSQLSSALLKFNPTLALI